jgi:hypothetical protein
MLQAIFDAFIVFLIYIIQSVSNSFVPGSGGYVACPRSAAGSQPVY